ncbi:protein-export chaperone SecB [Clostridium pasteurianum]|uniref:protein-export chaperone SecB n=1 Tax=Clostridium pasteurianum TaxID=1501 RepID=UPI002260F877|nr:protein-export chaperone SecB [Clostridium pasteurianum]UZW13820.1 protein-export chaperone SecB [Clostridium pasteurianum]
MEEFKSSLTFKDYIVEKVEFHNNLNFDNEKIKLDFDIDSDVKFSDDDNTFLLNLKVELFKNAVDNNYPFDMSLSIIGIFELDVTDKEKINTFAEVNGVAILFPYVRSIISTYTANANVQPLILPPINVIKYIEDRKKRENKKE